MNSRLYAHSARNQIGRMLGLSSAYTPGQIATAKVIYGAFAALPRCGRVVGAAVCGSTDGETSFLLLARGDHNEAGGMSQWHAARRDLILHHTGIDVWTASAVNQCRAMIAEISEPWSAYRHVLPKLEAMEATRSLQGAITVLVHDYEQSGSQARDIARRTALANYWIAYAEKHW